MSTVVVKVDGEWGSWQEWGSCTSTCNGGSKYRKRVCDNPQPAHGGQFCQGNVRDQMNCNTHPCPPVIGKIAVFHFYCYKQRVSKI